MLEIVIKHKSDENNFLIMEIPLGPPKLKQLWCFCALLGFLDCVSLQGDVEHDILATRVERLP